MTTHREEHDRVKQAIRHGHSRASGRSPTYRSWHMMKQRCLNPNVPRYDEWGGRGITICERWQSFENFLADMGIRPEGRTLDRIDNDGNYQPSNCRWATPQQQNANRRPYRKRKSQPAKAQCIRGHEFTPENTRVDASGWRRCLLCQRDYNREYMRNRRAMAVPL